MYDDEGVVRKVAWLEIFPWLTLVRCFRLAIRFRALVLATVAILATLSGWALLAWVFSADVDIAEQTRPFARCPWLALSGLVPDRPFATAPGPIGLGTIVGAHAPMFVRSEEPLVGSWEQLGRPVYEIFAQEPSAFRMFFFALCALWALGIWAFFGSAITRTTAVELAAGERIGWTSMLRHAQSKWLSCVGAPLLPLLAVGAVAVGTAVVGLLLRVGLGIVVAALLWPLVLLGWTVMALFLLGLLFGWPLMWAVIGAEGTDCFDALSRTYNYLFSRPLHALFYAVVAIGIGILGWLLVSNFAAAIVYLSYWAASWGAGVDAVYAVRTGDGLGPVGGFGGFWIRFWAECVKLLAVGFLYSYLWTTATGIYFLLRRDVDARELDEVFLEESPENAPSGLPPLRTDESGVPEVADKPQEGGVAENPAS